MGNKENSDDRVIEDRSDELVETITELTSYRDALRYLIARIEEAIEEEKGI